MRIYKIKVPGVISENQHKIRIKSGGVVMESVSLNGQVEMMPDHTAKSWHEQKYGFSLSAPEYQLHLTHRKAWELFLNSGDEYCCVIEENVDMEFDPDLIENALEQLEEGWDVFFPFDEFKSRSEDKTISHLSAALVNPNRREVYNRYPFYLEFLWGSHIYFLSEKGAVQLLSAGDIKQRVEDEIFFQTEHHGLETYYDEFSWFDRSAQPDFMPKERSDHIYDAVLNYNTWKPEASVLAAKILKELSELAAALQVELLLHGGTLLGYVRHGSIMPWDDDIDIGIEEKNVRKFFTGIRDSADLVYRIFTEGSTNARYYKIWSRHGAEIEGYDYTFPFVDIWLFNKTGNDVIFRNGLIFPNANLHWFLTVDFEGTEFQIPSNAVECLDAMYIDWKSKIRIYQWSHQEERINLLPLSTTIRVDEKGRITR